MKMKPRVNQAPEVMQVMSDIIENQKLGKLSTVKPLRESVVDFMKKVELMKESKKKPNDLIKAEKSKVIQQSNQDTDGSVSMKIKSHVIPESPRLETVQPKETSTSHVRY